MKWTNTTNPATRLNNRYPSQINPSVKFSTLMTTHTQSKRKQLIAVWSLDENSKLFCQWVPDGSRFFHISNVGDN